LPIKTKGKFHITSGHQTVMGVMNLFKEDKESELYGDK
jgi:hypothetical protein